MQSKGEAGGYHAADISLDCWGQFGFLDAMPSYCFLARKNEAMFSEAWVRLFPSSGASGVARASAFVGAPAVSPSAAPGPQRRARGGKRICWTP